ncbi:MAG TPA: gliding motility-associated C-terminal domain-containing protein, partial [Bacteroidales bacterium]|nr:gliding motility-associated C-terminal domain-containing protein [Bacteroidales bacterium]
NGTWSVLIGSGRVQDSSSPATTVSNLGIGNNILLWTVTNDVCPASSDTLTIIVHDLLVPTLITPNNDGRNDFLILRGTEELIDNELIIFDRRGVMVFRDDNYRNNWNGVDLNGKPLADDTYFYVFRSKGVPSRSGYIVIRR